VKRAWIIAAAAATAAAAGIAALLVPRPPEEFPLAGIVPDDAVFYAGFPDLASLERAAAVLPRAWTDPLRSRLEANRPHLSGGTAVYIDREFEWVFLARLRGTAALAAGVPVEDGAAVIARSPGALARHRARARPLAGHPEFRALRSRLFLNLEALHLPGRLGDFTAVGFEWIAGPPIRLSGRASYRSDLYRLYLEHYVHAPAGNGPPHGNPGATLVEHFPRLWDDLARELPPADRERLDRETAAISRDLLEGRAVRDFMGTLGPSCGLAVVPTPHDYPAVQGWIDLPDAAARDTLQRMILKAARDAENYARDRAQEPAFGISVEDSLWRLRFPGPTALRLGEAFKPALAFGENRVTFTTCADGHAARDPVPGSSQVALQVSLDDAFALARAVARLLAEGAFRDEAERAGAEEFTRSHPPEAVEARRRLLQERQDPKSAGFELAKFLGAERSRIVAENLQRISKTERYAAELARRLAAVDAWAGRLGWIEQASLCGRFTGKGFEFQLVVNPRQR